MTAPDRDMPDGREAGPPSLWLEVLGAEVRLRPVDGQLTRSLEAGAGEPVILLHGITGHAETWARNVVPLSQKHYRVHALDMLGHGLTGKPTIDYDVCALAQHVLGFMDAVGARRAHLVGQSLGGWVACWLAIRHPDRVASLVSVTGAGLELGDSGAALSADVGRKVGDATRKALDSPTREKVRARLEWLMHDPAVVTDELVETRFRIYTRPDFAAVAGDLVEAFTARPRAEDMLTSERLQRITCPTLLLWTRQNPTMPWQVGEAASRIIPGASFALMEDAGHWPQYEKPTEFNRIVGDFLGQAGAAVSDGLVGAG